MVFQKPLLSVILHSARGFQDLEACLNALGTQTLASDRFEIVISAGSGRVTDKIFGQQSPEQNSNVKVLVRPGCDSAVASINHSILNALGDVVVLHDCCFLAAHDYLERCLSFHSNNPGEGALLLPSICLHPSVTNRPISHWLLNDPNCQFSSNQVQSSNTVRFRSDMISCKRSIFRYGLPDNRLIREAADLDFSLKLNEQLPFKVVSEQNISLALAEYPLFKSLLLNAFRRKQAERALYSIWGERMRDALLPHIFSADHLAAQLRPEIHKVLSTAGRLEGFEMGVPDNYSSYFLGGEFKGIVALLTAYSVSLQFAQCLGWLAGAAPVETPNGQASAAFEQLIDSHYAASDEL